jgi:Flp pilus assembly protein TadG
VSRNDERGQVTVLILGMALLAFAVAGLAVDGTRAWLLRRSLQNAADAAALAGASELDRGTYYASGGRIVTLDPASGEATAKRWLDARGTGAGTVVSATDDGVAVRVSARMQTSFLALVGITTLEVAVEADAVPIAGTP